MRKKRIFHAMGKTQFGGVMLGFIERYHEESTDDVVKRLPRNAIPYTKIKLIIRIFQLILLLLLFIF